MAVTFSRAVKLTTLLLSSMLAFDSVAADYQDGDTHKNDYKWLQFNLMHSVDAKIPYGARNATYLEMEFGGRSGIFDLYGYVDMFDIFGRKQDDRHEGDNFFAKLAPRMSLDGLLGRDLSVGPVQEWYIATVTNIGDRELFEHYIGLGSDVKVPWFGKVGMNVYARYVRENYGAANESGWDGYMFSTNWFTPFYHFANGSFLSYQGYMDYHFASDKLAEDKLYSNRSVEWFNGLYWHSDRYAVGYGPKYFYNMALIQDNMGAGRTTGWGHYFSMTYKF